MNLFGTDGIRSKVGSYPLTPNDLIDLGKAISLWSQNKYGNSPKILIAHDTRLSCSFIKSTLCTGLLQYNVHLYDAEILPTPAIYQLVQKQKLFDCAIVITASHNEYQDNGIKIVDSQNHKLAKDDENLISKIFFNKEFINLDYENLGKLIYWNLGREKYINYLVNFFKSNFLKNYKIVIDCGNGASENIAPEIFKNFGADLITINNQSNGKNINKNCGSTKPESLQKAVIENNAKIGFAFDGDGDRVIVVNEKGQIKDGDEILALLLDHPLYNDINRVISTVICNYGLELYLKNKNVDLIRTDVGDKHVVEALKKENSILGGEPSGHIILADYLNSSDGIFTALRILETTLITNNWSLDTFEKFPQYTFNLPIAKKENLEQEPFATIIANYKKQNPGRLVVRYSGTELLLRIMVEAKSLELAKKIATDLANDLNLIFKTEIKDACYEEKTSNLG